LIGDNYGGNPALTSLTGLENIDAGSISSLHIENNYLLSTCEVQSICDYLVAPNGTISIYGNAPGCNSQQEVEEACEIHCLPEGITFTTQAEIDSFQINYPYCTEIEGDVTINGDDITNLNGLNVLTAIGGTLVIGDFNNPYSANPLLYNLEGLESLVTIGGDLWIVSNQVLAGLAGLDNLNVIHGSFYIGGGLFVNWGNPFLASLSGLDNLTLIVGDLFIFNNDSLTILSGLEGLTSIEGSLLIENSAQSSLSGLDNLTSIGGTLFIGAWGGGTALTSLTGLENLTSIGEDLILGWGHGTMRHFNPYLLNLTGLENLSSIGGSLGIYENNSLTSLTGLENLTSLAGDLIIGPSEYGNPSLTSLTGLEGVTSIGGEIEIYHNDALTSLTGLDNLTSITGKLRIVYNDALTNLTGLDELVFVGGDLVIYENELLADLTGLNNLMSILGSLNIGYISGSYVYGNPSLTELTGLENLTSIGEKLEIIENHELTSITAMNGLDSIGGYLKIYNNDALISLSGLDSISEGSIENLYIHDNESLSTCDVYSVCEYLIALGGDSEIYNNAIGCNSPQEVMDSCGVWPAVEEFDSDEIFTISPNPLKSTSLIKYTIQHKSPVTIKILDLTGQEIMTLVDDIEQQGKQQIIFNTVGLPAGIYFCTLKTRDGIQTRKIIKL
jgi:hypothetical protein